MVTPVPIAVTPVPNAVSIPPHCDVTNTMAVPAPVPNTSSIPVPNATNAGNNKWPDKYRGQSVCGQTSTEKECTGRKSKDEKEIYMDT